MSKQDFCLICDIGYGDVKYIVLNDKGQSKQGKIPTLVGVHDIYDTEYKAEFKDTNLLEKDGTIYSVGPDRGISMGTRPISSMGDNFLVNYGPLFLAKIAQIEKLRPENISMSILSLAYLEFDKKKKALQKACSSFTISKKRFEQEVEVFMQGRGVWFDQGNPSDCLIIDIGFNTVDCVIFLDGSMRYELSFGLKGFGTSNFINAVREHLNKAAELQLTVNQVQQMIMAKDRVLDKYEMWPVVEKFSKNWITRLINELETHEVYNNARKMMVDIIIAGGGAYYMQGIDLPDGYKIIENEPEFSNVRGFRDQILGDVK